MSEAKKEFSLVSVLRLGDRIMLCFTSYCDAESFVAFCRMYQEVIEKESMRRHEKGIDRWYESAYRLEPETRIVQCDSVPTFASNLVFDNIDMMLNRILDFGFHKNHGYQRTHEAYGEFLGPYQFGFRDGAIAFNIDGPVELQRTPP